MKEELIPYGRVRLAAAAAAALGLGLGYCIGQNRLVRSGKVCSITSI
jgi:ABC-type nitrate/sulfonate/bicarbonate transport system permease component